MGFGVNVEVDGANCNITDRTRSLSKSIAVDDVDDESLTGSFENGLLMNIHTKRYSV
jgi:hypothetical protein